MGHEHQRREQFGQFATTLLDAQGRQCVAGVPPSGLICRGDEKRLHGISGRQQFGFIADCRRLAGCRAGFGSCFGEDSDRRGGCRDRLAEFSLFLLRFKQLCKLAVVSGLLGGIQQDRLGLSQKFMDDLEGVGSLGRFLFGGTFASSKRRLGCPESLLDLVFVGAKGFQADDLVVVQLGGRQLTVQVLLDSREYFVHDGLVFHGEFAVFQAFASQSTVESLLLELDQASEGADPDHHQQRGAVAEQEHE